MMFLPFYLLLGAAPPTYVTDLRVESLTAEQLRDGGLVIGATKPRLSWTLVGDGRGLSQAAYQVRIGDSVEALRSGDDRFESTRIASGESANVAWPGPELTSRDVLWWQVRVWLNGQEQPTAWSRPERFAVGLLTPGDWQAQWIGNGSSTPEDEAAQYGDDPAPLLRREFAVAGAPVAATLYVVGLGYARVRLDGQELLGGLDQPWTEYGDRVTYRALDLTDRLAAGQHCLAVELGNGWWNPLPMRFWGWLNLREHLTTGRPRLLAQLELTYADGRREVVASDGSWRVAPGPIVRNNIYLGELRDQRREPAGWWRAGFDDSGWAAATIDAQPVGRLEPTRMPRVLPVLKPQPKPPVVREVEPGVYLLDFQQNLAGQVEIDLDLPAGREIKLRYGELLNGAGRVNPMTAVAGQIKGGNGGPGAPHIAEQSDTYITSGEPNETFHSTFTWRAFRYVEVSGLPSAPDPLRVRATALSSAIDRVAQSEFSDPVLNQLQTICDNTFRANTFHVQSDCPGRERYGYGGDLVATAETFLTWYDMSQFYSKAARDWDDAQLPDGMLTDTAPFVGIQFCGVPWAVAHPHLLDQLIRYYGDFDLAAEQYPVSVRWMDAIAKLYPEHIVTDGLSDHESLDALNNPELGTPFYYLAARTMERLAHHLHKPADKQRWSTLAAAIAREYQERFIAADGTVGPGTQSAQAIALGTGIVPENLRAAAGAKLLAVLRESGHLRTGIMGTYYIWDVLREVPGGTATLLNIVRDPMPTGYGHMLDQGATTLWEHWNFSDNTYSHSHPMFGSVSGWLHQTIAGLAVAPDAIASNRLRLAPEVDCGLDSARASWTGPRGTASSAWRWDDERLRWEVTIPHNTTAEVRLPVSAGHQVTVGGQPWAAAVTRDGQWRAELGSGTWEIVRE